MVDDLSDPWDAIRRLQARIDRMERSNPLESASVTGGRVRFIDGSTLDVEGFIKLLGAMVVQAGGSITVEGEYPIVIHNNGSGEALIELGGGGIVGNGSGLTLTTPGGAANIAVKADKIEINRGGKAFHVTSTGFLMGGVPPEASTSGLRLLAVKTDGTVVSVPIGSGGSGPGVPVDPTDPSKTFRWPFVRTPHGTYDGHSGVDWARSTGTPIKAIGNATVEAVYSYSGNTYPGDSSEPVWRGNCIVLNHGTIGGVRVSSLYAHMQDAPTLAVGATVTSGQTIGAVGNTGFSDGSHLHFEVYFNGIRKSSGEGGYEQAIAWMDANASGSWG